MISQKEIAEIIDTSQPITTFFPNLESTYMRLDSLDWKSDPPELINLDSIFYGFMLSIDDKISDFKSNSIFEVKLYAEKVRNSDGNVLNKTDIQINKFIKCEEVLKVEGTSDNFFSLLSNFTCLDWKYNYNFYQNNNFTEYVKLGLFPCQNCDRNLLNYSTVTVVFFSLDIVYDSKGMFSNYRPALYEFTLKPEFTNIYKETYTNIFYFFRYFNILKYLPINIYLKDIKMTNSIKDRVSRNSNSTNDPYLSISANFDFNCIQRDLLRTKFMNNLGLIGNICFLCFFVGKIVFSFIKKDENTCYLMNESMYIVDPKEKERIKLWEANLKDNDKKKGDGIILVKEDYHNYNEM